MFNWNPSSSNPLGLLFPFGKLLDGYRVSFLEGTGDEAGFGPVSKVRKTDFTLIFEQSVLMILPTALLMLTTIVTHIPRLWQGAQRTSSPIMLNEKARDGQREPIKLPKLLSLPIENNLIRFKILLFTKLLVNIGAAVVLLTLAGLSDGLESGSTIRKANISGYAVSAVNMLAMAILSYRAHCASWLTDLTLQIILLGQMLALAIRTRTESTVTEEQSRVCFALLVASTAIVLGSAILESVPRITRERLLKDAIPPEMNINIFNYPTFIFAQSFISKAFSHYQKNEAPDVDMLWSVGDDLKSTPITLQFEEEWKRETQRAHLRKQKPRLLLLLIKLHYANLFPALTLSVLYSVAQFASPNILNGLLAWLTKSRNDPFSFPIFEGFQYALGFLAVRTFTACLQATAQYQMGRELLRVRAGIMGAIYRKTMRLAPEEKGKRTLGDIVSHITVDAETIGEGSGYLQVFVRAIPTLGLGTYFLYQQLRWAALVGLGWMLIVIATTQVFNSQALSKAFGKRMKELDQRTTLVNEVISNIKIVKFAAWEGQLLERIRELRKREMGHLRSMVIALSRVIFPTALSGTGALLIMFIVYTTKIAIPNASTIFVTIALFEILYTPIEQIGFGLGWLLTVRKASARISSFLNAEELRHGDTFCIDARLQSSSLVANLQDTTFTWIAQETEGSEKAKEKEKEVGRFTLTVPSLDVCNGELLAIVGRVGCGKSSLVQAILGQMHILTGKVTLSDSRIAYCPQSPFIFAGSVKQNIIGFDLEENGALLDVVVRACALRDDIRQLPGELGCELGEKGINLSGGQRSRIALARACYSTLSSQTSFVILDSMLESVDADTDAHIWREAIGSTGILKNCTRILITHGTHHLHDADRICYLEEGRIRETGLHAQLLENDGPYRRLITEFTSEKERQSDSSVKAKPDKRGSNTEDGSMSGEPSNLVASEELRSGRIAGKTYATYFCYAGWRAIVVVFGMWAFLRVANISGQFWLSYWVNTADAAVGRHSAFYLGIYSIFSAVFFFGIPLCLAAVGLLMVLPASRKVYDKMIANVLRAPMGWFHVTPTGRISNRLTSDMSQMDWDILVVLASTLSTFSNILTNLISSAIATRGLLLTTVPFLLPVYWWLFLYYTATSRSVRRLDAGRTRAPMVSQASETIQGSAVIAAIGANKYLDSFYGKVDLNQSTKLIEYASAGWLSIRIDFMASILVFASSTFAVVLRTKLTPSLAGLAVSTTLTIAGLLNSFLDVATQLETAAVHAERCIEYAEELPSEAPAHLSSDETLPNWPRTGAVSFNNISARYRPDLPLSLRDVDVQIPAQTKVAVVGRTGSGKSSLTLTLFRLLELSSGSITIDGVDISSLGLEKLRKSIAIIPQENQALAGTIRSNLNPFSERTEDELWQALEAAQLKDFVSSLDEKLDTEVQVSGANFSAGQLQQLGLARALLLRTKVVVLDEATSSLDLETDAAIQNVIRTYFRDATMITIAHRLRTVMDSELVIVMKDGTVGEIGSPKTLLNNPESLFRALAVEAGEI